MTNTSNTAMDLSHLGLLSIAGKDAEKLLQGQLTCDLTEVCATQSRLGAHCNPQGRIISLFRLFNYQDQYYLQMPKELLPIAKAALQKYAVFYKVTISIDDTLQQAGYYADALRTRYPELPLENNAAICINDTLIIKIPGSVERYLLIGAHLDIENKIAESSWKMLDIRANIPAIYPETSEKFLPHEINLPLLNAVSFKKGCFTGQEIIARMEYRGKLKKHLYRAEVQSDDAPIRGADIFTGKETGGKLVDFCQLSYHHYELLVIAQDNPPTLSLDTDNQVIITLIA